MTVFEAQILRAAGPEDEPLLFALFAEEKAAQMAGVGLGAAQIGSLIEMQYRGRRLTYAAQHPAAEDSILLGPDGEAAGHLLLDRQADRWLIVDIAVLATHRGRGLGTRVLAGCQRQAAAAAAGLELQVTPLNPARRLYERLGFRAIDEDAVSVKMVWGEAK